MVENENTAHADQQEHQIIFDILVENPIPPSVDDTAVETINRVEKILAQAGILPDSNMYRPGAMTHNYSRLSVDAFPQEDVRIIKQQKGAANRGIRQNALQRVQELLGDTSVTEKDITIRRLLDSPRICEQYITANVLQQTMHFEELLKNSPYTFRKQQKLITNNKARHHQRATLGSYISRAFAPDELPAVTIREVQKGDIDARRELIENLPLEPEKVSDEIIIKLGLAPEGFKDYTLQARLRYKLAIREHLFRLFARAQVVDRPQTDKDTARICTLLGAHGNQCVAIFRTVTDLHIQNSGGEKPRRRFHPVSEVACSIFTGKEEALRSQDHATEKLTKKAEDYAAFQKRFRNYRTYGIEAQKLLIAEAQKACEQHGSFFDAKIKEHLMYFSEHLEHYLTLKIIIQTYHRAIRDAIAKKQEIAGVRELLVHVWS